MAPRPLSTALVPWRGPAGEPRLTVVVKATFDLREGDEAAATDSYPLFRDVHHEDNEGRSLFVASDFAVRKICLLQLGKDVRIHPDLDP